MAVDEQVQTVVVEKGYEWGTPPAELLPQLAYQGWAEEALMVPSWGLHALTPSEHVSPHDSFMRRRTWKRVDIRLLDDTGAVVHTITRYMGRKL